RGAYHGRPAADLDVRQRRVGPQDDIVTDGAAAVDLGLRMDGDVTPERDVDVDPGRGRGDHGPPSGHPALQGAAVQLGAQPRQLDPVVDALRLPEVLDRVCAHSQAVAAHDPQHISE